jgi:hypothetical protein
MASRIDWGGEEIDDWAAMRQALIVFSRNLKYIAAWLRTQPVLNTVTLKGFYNAAWVPLLSKFLGRGVGVKKGEFYCDHAFLDEFERFGRLSHFPEQLSAAESLVVKDEEEVTEEDIAFLEMQPTTHAA